MSFGSALYASLLARELTGKPVSPDVVAHAVPNVLFWAVPPAIALTVVLLALPKTRR